MKIILENALDFRQFQNLFILTFVTLLLFLGTVSSVDFKTYFGYIILLFILNVLFIAVLFTKKGLLAESKKLYAGLFLFGFVLRKTHINLSRFKKLALYKGKLSTNYAYSYSINDFHKWEPNLNQSADSVTLFAVDENETHQQKILRLTKFNKVKPAIECICRNTHLNHGETRKSN